MSSGLAVYGAVPNTIELINSMGVAIAKSRLLGCENEDQGRVLAMTCIVKGVDPLTLAQKYDIIQGKLAMKAANMLAEFRILGGRHKIHQRDADRVSIELSIHGESMTFSLSWDEIKDEAYTKTKTGTHKENYSTPRRRMQMMWARLISDAVRAMAPEVNAGVYTPEEVADFDDSAQVVTGKVHSAKLLPPAVKDGERETGPSQVEAFEQTSEQSNKPLPAFVPEGATVATGEQINRIGELFRLLAIDPDKQSKAFRKRGAGSMVELTTEGAADLITSLEGLYATSQQADSEINEVAGESPVDTQVQVLPSITLALPEQVDAIKSCMREIAQIPGNSDISERVKAKLKSCGLVKLADLSRQEADAVLAAMQKKTLEAFFAMELRGERPF